MKYKTLEVSDLHMWEWESASDHGCVTSILKAAEGNIVTDMEKLRYPTKT